MDLTRTSHVPDDSGSSPVGVGRCCPIIELRQYTLHPGQRETLIDLFDRELVESQEATGMTVIAQFRDVDRPNVFTWMRGFPDMPSRAKSLESFYFGPVWARHSDAANATMISWDNVRLLHPVTAGSGFALGGRAAPGAAMAPIPGVLIVATIYTLKASEADDFGEFFDNTIAPIVTAHGARPFAILETEPSANNFPRLPVREGERAFVWFARFGDAAAYDRHVQALTADQRWGADVRGDVEHRSAAPAETWRLTPTRRSRTLE
jgi:quinol monooxygenase YgiN